MAPRAARAHGSKAMRIYARMAAGGAHACWMDIGRAEMHADGKGFDLYLEHMPLSALSLVARLAGNRPSKPREKLTRGIPGSH